MAEKTEKTIGQEVRAGARTWLLRQVLQFEQDVARVGEIETIYAATLKETGWLRARRGYVVSDVDERMQRLATARLREARANIAMLRLLATKLRALADALGPGGADGDADGTLAVG